jgi:hypothetical protein
MQIEERIKKEFDTKKYIQIKEIIPLELCNFLTANLLLQNRIDGKGDGQVNDCLAVINKGTVFNSLLELLWDRLENTLSEKLIPTYSYARLYKNGNILKRHIDRPSCEISMTIQLGRSHHYSWPIFVGGNRIDLAEGDAVIYKGNEIEHWREKCDGPDGYYSGQVFLHYVKENGVHKDHAFDKIENPNNEVVNKFIKNSTFLMESK